MNKIFSFLLLFGFLFLTVNISEAAINSYDKYGKKVGSYRETSSGFNSYDKNGSKTGSYRKTSGGYNKYDKNLNFLVKKEFKGSLLKCLNLTLENAANYNDISAIIDNTS